MKVRGTKVAEWIYGDSTFAVVKMADPDEATFVTPGSDQADAVLRLEAIAAKLDCPPESIEERLDDLLYDDEPDELTELLQIIADMGFDPVLVLGTNEELAEFLK